jgi:NMD protein affecting ribosome stability and mRNA decay
MVKNHLRTDSELIQIGYEESLDNDEIEIFCEPCFKTFHDKVEATHEAFNVEMCYDCWSEFNE